MKKIKVLRWPYPYRWAFGITDDTDACTMKSDTVFYNYCLERGIRPTKTVWTHNANEKCGVVKPNPPDEGLTLDDATYRDHCVELQERGIEIALHGVSPGNNKREDIIRGFARFNDEFGQYPRTYACHDRNAEHPYWGEKQFTSNVARNAVRFLIGKHKFYGEDPKSPYYWSDICKQHIDYMRLFRTVELDVMKVNPMMPYHQYEKPDVRFWFSASGNDLPVCRKINKAALDKIARNDGMFMLYMHSGAMLASAEEGRHDLRPEIENAFETIAARNDFWSAGVSEILDRCLATKNVVVIPQRHALLISNPTSVCLKDFQFEAEGQEYWLNPETRLMCDEHGRFHIDELAAGATLPLYFTRQEAEIGDPVGISTWETQRMAIEEGRRKFGQWAFRRIHRARKRLIRWGVLRPEISRA